MIMAADAFEPFSTSSLKISQQDQNHPPKNPFPLQLNPNSDFNLARCQGCPHPSTTRGSCESVLGNSFAGARASAGASAGIA